MRPLLLIVLLTLAAPGLAQLPDAAGWIRQCLDATASRPAAQPVRAMYCTCMVSQANDAGTATLAALEQLNPDAARQCRELAGWR